MALGHRTIPDLETILRAGGSLDLNGGFRSVDDLSSLARTARASGAKLIIRGAGHRNVEDLASIARAGGGSVTFGDWPAKD